MANKITQEQFVAYYDEYSDRIYRYCYFRVYDSEKAKDLVQEVFLRTWQYIAKGEEIQNIQAFLYRVALNSIINDSRKKKPVSLNDLQDAGFDPASDSYKRFPNAIDGRSIVAALDKLLDDKHRDVVILRYINDLDPKEIAQVTGDSVNVISVRLHRALKQLRAILPPLEQGSENKVVE